jgi:hypothetical protein
VATELADVVATSGTAEDRLAGVLQRLIAKAQREQQEQQPDMADVLFSFSSGDSTIALTTLVPQAAARVTFPCRLVSACVFEASEPAIPGSVQAADEHMVDHD